MVVASFEQLLSDAVETGWMQNKEECAGRRERKKGKAELHAGPGISGILDPAERRGIHSQTPVYLHSFSLSPSLCVFCVCIRPEIISRNVRSR